MHERRKWKRYSTAHPIEFHGKYTQGAIALVDVSREGLAFTTPEELKVGDKIELQIFLKKKMFRLEALVLHSKAAKDKRHNIGAKFINTPDDFIKKLEQEIEEIESFHREAILYKDKDLTFKKASLDYLINGL
jgi:hypothetical protein